MFSKIKGSHILALAFVAAIGLWMSGGQVVVGGQTPEPGEGTPPIAEQTEENQAAPFKVSFVAIEEIDRERNVSVRGRTKADAIIPIRAETGGILAKRLVSRGDFVNVNDVVCEIEPGARESALAGAKASLERAEAEYEANRQLAEKGFASQIKLREMRANMDAAKAALREAEVELSRIVVKANASGFVQDPIASVGDVLQPGSTCVTLNDSDPMFFSGQIAEREVGAVKPGMKASVSLVTGERITGTVSYVASSADTQTRTFLTEIRLDDTGATIRDGLTATAMISLPPTRSFKISPSWVSLADSGQVGVKIVDEGNKVGFKPIEILSQTNNGFWVSGLESGDRIITLGQEYVISGEIVEPVPDPIVNAELTQ